MKITQIFFSQALTSDFIFPGHSFCEYDSVLQRVNNFEFTLLSYLSLSIHNHSSLSRMRGQKCSITNTWDERRKIQILNLKTWGAKTVNARKTREKLSGVYISTKLKGRQKCIKKRQIWTQQVWCYQLPQGKLQTRWKSHFHVLLENIVVFWKLMKSVSP